MASAASAGSWRPGACLLAATVLLLAGWLPTASASWLPLSRRPVVPNVTASDILDMTVDIKGNPSVCFSNGKPVPNAETYVSSWTGTSWTGALGGGKENLSPFGFYCALEADASKPGVLYIATNDNQVTLRKWTGSKYVTLGKGLSGLASSNYVINLQTASSPEAGLVICYTFVSGQFGDFNGPLGCVRYKNGAKEVLGPSTGFSPAEVNTDFGLSVRGSEIVTAFTSRQGAGPGVAYRWNDAIKAWQPLGAAFSPTFCIFSVVAHNPSTGEPWVAYMQRDPQNTNNSVVYAASYTDGKWVRRGRVIRTNSEYGASPLSLAFSSAGRAHLGYACGKGNPLCVSKFAAGKWAPLGTQPVYNNKCYVRGLTLDFNGTRPLAAVACSDRTNAFPANYKLPVVVAPSV